MTEEFGIIEIRLENVSKEKTLKYREIIHELIKSGSFDIKGGCVMLHFDHIGTLQRIQHDHTKWVRPKHTP